jgi:hypothetical protein
MRAERPKVLYNNLTEKYVMWMHADDYNFTLRRAGVATACWPSGPFTFLSTFRPDNNETMDLTVFQNSSGSAFLARTYYANKTYYLPAPVMQPIWQSVQQVGSVPDTPIIDFSMNYHRAFYHHGYDNIDDIYTQRWRKEDVEWRIQTGNIVETFDPMDGKFVLTDIVENQEIARASPARRQAMLAQSLDNRTFRNIIGQVSRNTTVWCCLSCTVRRTSLRGLRLRELCTVVVFQGQPPILTRYKRPEEHSFWMPSSVPAVKAQPWQFNYYDNNIADNPVHETVSDLLIGPER